MPLTFTPIDDKTNWAGCRWEVVDDDQLAEHIARVAMGQSRYVRRILTELNVGPAKGKKTALDGALELLTANPTFPYHRDGWMFQVISWISAHMQGIADVIAYPHTIHAHKGFDGLHVRFDKLKKTVSLVVICEEKATTNTQNLVGRIWKEFAEMESGSRDNELTDQLTHLLENRSDIDVDKAIEEVIWNDARAYRVSVTIDDEFNSKTGYAKLFKGYPTTISGNVDRRRSEVLYSPDIRDWLDKLAEKAIKFAKKMDKN